MPEVWLEATEKTAPTLNGHRMAKVHVDYLLHPSGRAFVVADHPSIAQSMARTSLSQLLRDVCPLPN